MVGDVLDSWVAHGCARRRRGVAAVGEEEELGDEDVRASVCPTAPLQYEAGHVGELGDKQERWESARR
jgi:hypothetical protein